MNVVIWEKNSCNTINKAQQFIIICNPLPYSVSALQIYENCNMTEKREENKKDVSDMLNL